MPAQRVDAPCPTSVLTGMEFIGGEPFISSSLPGGLTNRNYRVRTADGRQYVARFSDSQSALLSIDRDAEANNSRVAAELGVGPGVVAYVPDERLLVVDWIEGHTCTDADLDDAATLARIAGTCRAMHAGPRFAGEFDMFRVQRGYLDIVRSERFRLPGGYLDYEPQVRLLDQVLHASSTGTVPCHNDLLAANIIDDGRIWFVDFEYSGNNDPCFELGNIWSEAELPPNRLEHLVTSYFGAPSPVQTARAQLFGVVAKYGWMLWASIQDAVSDVDFDFWTWGMAKYERAEAEFRSASFTNAIDIIREDFGQEGARSWPQST
jgi:thiamine kinase-like enzyme